MRVLVMIHPSGPRVRESLLCFRSYVHSLSCLALTSSVEVTGTATITPFA